MMESIAKVTMGALLVATVPIDQVGLEPWANWSLAGLVVGYVLLRDHQREKRMGAAIDSQQRWIRETLVGALERNATAMERMVTWLEAAEDPRRATTRRLPTLEVGDGHHR